MSDSHGNTPAAWTGTLIMILGSLLVCFGIVWGMVWLWVLGAVLIVAGALAWNIMGKKAAKQTARH